MKINWSKYFFFNFKRKRKNKVIGNEIFSYYRSNGKFMIIDGLCIYIKSKNFGLLTSSFDIDRTNDADYYLNIPFYLNGMLYFKVVRKTYGFKINCSKLTRKRYKNKS